MEKCYRIFVIVVVYKGKRWYDHCFGSLRKSTVPITTIAIDNASGDGSVEFIREHFPEVVLLENKENLGFGKANNIGMRYALDHDCDYVFLLNQDAWIEQDTIEKLCSVYERHKEYGIISPMHLNVNRTALVMEHFCRQSNNEKLITDLYLNQLFEIYETSYIHAAAWMLSKRTLQIVGGFDPIFFHYEEDDDYLNRVRFHQLKIGVCPKAQIIHDHQVHPIPNDLIQYRHNQYKLVEYLDLNHPFHIGSYLCYYLRKWIVGFLHMKISLCRSLYNDILFLMRNSKRIKYSRKNNSVKGETWLNGNLDVQ